MYVYSKWNPHAQLFINRVTTCTIGVKMTHNVFWLQKWIPHAQLPINRHTELKICAKMTHNVPRLAASAPVRMLQNLFWPQKWIARAQLRTNWHTTCKIYDEMTHNVTSGCERASENASIFILTSEMNFWCPVTCKTTYNMQNLSKDDP